MKISIKQGDTPVSIIRKNKINKINVVDNNVKFMGYDWKLQREYEGEDLRDFHLFCLSIAKELISNNASTNENGKIEYIKLQNSEDIIVEMNKLFNYIATDKICNP